MREVNLYQIQTGNCPSVRNASDGLLAAVLNQTVATELFHNTALPLMPLIRDKTMDEQALANHFKEVAKTQRRDIWLFGREISSLPPEIGLLSNVRQIYLDKNQLTTLPPEIGQLSNLEYLELHSNKITALLDDGMILQNFE